MCICLHKQCIQLFYNLQTVYSWFDTLYFSYILCSSLNMCFWGWHIFYFYLIFHHMNKAQFIYLPPYRWTCRLFPFFSIANNVAINIIMQIHKVFMGSTSSGGIVRLKGVHSSPSADISKFLFNNCSVYTPTSRTWECPFVYIFANKWLYQIKFCLC